jgi:hypothetical protein
LRSPDWLGEHDDDVLVTQGQSENAKIEAWRLKELIDAGYPMSLAELIAVRPSIDLHKAIELVKNGCAPELAAEILL